MSKPRIVSFLPAATEMVFALGAGDQLVGISHECDFPPQAKGKPAVVRPALDLQSMTLREIDVAVAEQIRSGRTLLISGGTATGKTTVLRALATAIPEEQRIVVIEDTSELHLQKPNLLSVECQTDTFKASVTFDDLLKSALRWRPDRIILGEVRGIEARTLLDSLNTGHTGSLATIHANSAAKALRRFANLVLRSHAQATFEDIEAEIGEAVDYVVHVEREPGRRVVREVLQIVDYDRRNQQFKLEAVYKADSTVDPNSNPIGKD